MLDSFIKWMGGKSRLRKEIIGLIPPHRSYVEPFGGAGWVLFAKPPSPAEFFNDIDNSLINLYLTIRDHLDEFIQYLDNIPISETLFNRYRNGIPIGSKGYTAEVPVGIPFDDHYSEDAAGIPSVASAAQFYYIVMNAFNGKIAGIPSLAVNPGKESAFVKFYSIEWGKIQERLKHVTILCRDFGDVIKTLDRKETFFYFDPPYICATDNTRYYRYTFSLDDHSRLLVYLCELKGKFLLSYGDSPEIREKYSDFQILESLTSPGELFILNYEPPDPPFYSVCRDGIPEMAPEEKVYHTSRQRAPWTEPNCPECGSRLIQQLYKRITLKGGSRNWIPNGYTCNSCGALFKGIVDQEGIPNIAASN